MVPIITIASCVMFIIMLMVCIHSMKENGEQLKSIVSGMISLLSFVVFIISITLK